MNKKSFKRQVRILMRINIFNKSRIDFIQKYQLDCYIKFMQKK